MGYSVRTQAWRYTVWRPWLGANGTFGADWTAPFAEELYDHAGDDSTDMDQWENVNMAASNPAVAAQLHAQVRAFFEPRENKTYPPHEPYPPNEQRERSTAADLFVGEDPASPYDD